MKSLLQQFKEWQGTHSYKIVQSVIWFIAISIAIPMSAIILAEVFFITNLLIYFFVVMAIVIIAFVTKPV